MTKTFWTIFPHCKQYDLVKDPGMVPFFLSKLYNYNAVLVSFEKLDFAKVYKDWDENKFSNLNLPKPKKSRFGKLSLRVMRFVATKTKNVDVLNFYHFKVDTLIYIALYKLFNGKGKVYLKSDMDLNLFETIVARKNSFKGSLYYNFKRIQILLFYSWCDLISFESEQSRLKFNQILRLKKNVDKTFYLTNGFYSEFIKGYNADYTKKENLIISVGRIGTLQKNNEMLLSALSAMPSTNNWKVCFIGPIEQSFLPIIDDFYNKRNDLKDYVVFTGNLTDKDTLYDFYLRSKSLILTSIYEGFPLVIPEALVLGNYLILTKFASACSVIQNDLIGSLVDFNDVPGLIKILNKVFFDNQITIEHFNKTCSVGTDSYLWENIIPRLNEKLLEIC